ncbi:MAG: YraN family protein [Candidatus Eisenbacteria bacterium]|nr:YraN family protein [Candidatus Eisenbacteria bacterium]
MESRCGNAERSARGAAAETIAAAYLRLRGCEIVGRNVRAGGGEIDIVARRGDWLLLVEVRFRRDDRFGLPVETIRGRKRDAIRRAAHAYLSGAGGRPACWRCDIVSVDLLGDGDMRVRHYPNAIPL